MGICCGVWPEPSIKSHQNRCLRLSLRCSASESRGGARGGGISIKLSLEAASIKASAGLLVSAGNVSWAPIQRRFGFASAFKH